MMTCQASLMLVSVLMMLSGTVWSTAPSTKLLSFVSMYNGDFDNSEQVQRNRDYDLIKLTFKPVYLPVLQSDIALFFEESRGDEVLRLQVYTVTEDDQGNIHLDTYLFTDPSQHRPGDYDIADLQTLTKDDFHRTDGCNDGDCVYALEETGVFMGTCVSCAQRILGVYPTYVPTITCHGMGVVMAMGAKEKFQSVPYAFKLKGNRYALPPQVLENVSEFASPCEN